MRPEHGGLLLGKGDTVYREIELRNTAPNPLKEYRYSKVWLLLYGIYAIIKDWSVIGEWHTHPSGINLMSKRDKAVMLYRCKSVKWWLMLIIGTKRVLYRGEYKNNKLKIQEIKQ